MKSMSLLLGIIASAFAIVADARADDGRQLEFSNCMQLRHDKSYCNCRIIMNPRYQTNNMFIKIVAAQECARMYGTH